MKKVLTLTAAALMSVVGSIAVAENIKISTVVVNSTCTDVNSNAGLCYFSMKALPFDGSVLIADRTVEQIREANPNIDSFIVGGHLPRFHVIATVPVES